MPYVQTAIFSIKRRVPACLQVQEQTTGDPFAGSNTEQIEYLQPCLRSSWINARQTFSCNTVSCFIISSTILCDCAVMQEEAQKTRQKEGSTNEDTEDSPFASISATMGWDTFHLVQSVWLSIIDLPAAAPGNKWELQASSNTRLLNGCIQCL